jgi:hypothetical protein
MKSENKKPKPSALYANQFITMHSNITRDDTEYLPASYEDLKRPSQSESSACAGFMLIANNIYNNQKIYDLTNSSERAIEVWFNDTYGNIIPVQTAYSTDHGTWDEIYKAVFKIECELAIIDE